MARARAAVLILCACCAFWGLSFPLMQLALAAMARIAHHAAAGDLGMRDDLALRAGYNGLRFAGAAALYALIAGRALRGVTVRELAAAALTAGLFSAGLFCQLLGLRWTLPSISAVLTAMAVVFTPAAQALIARRPVGRWVWAAAGTAAAGMVLLATPDPAATAANTVATAPPWPYAGVAATLLGTLLFTGQIFCTDRWAATMDVRRFTLIGFAVTSATSLALCLALGGSPALSPGVVLALAGDPAWLVSSAIMIVLSSVVAFHLMNRWQPHVPPAVAAVAYVCEPVFALAWSLALGTERLTAATAIGGTVVLAGVLLVAVRR